MTFSLFNIPKKEPAANSTSCIKKVDYSLSEKYDKLIQELDEYQRGVVTAPDSENMCCVAGPGSGKTKTIISRAIKLVYADKVDPTQIVLITFTNKAAKELKQRYIDFFQDQYPTAEFPTPHISTIHSFCLHQIKRTFGFPRTILSEYHSAKLFKEICKKVCLSFGEENPDISTINKLYKTIEDLQSSMDLLFAGIPLFNPNGTFDKIIAWEERKNLPFYELLELMPYSHLSQLVTGQTTKIKKSNTIEIIESHLGFLPFKYETKIAILTKFIEEKYKNKCVDFNDMDFQYLLLMAQFEHLREKIHKRILHILIDEMQDSSTNQFLVGIFSDKESFETFYKFRNKL